MSAGSTPVIEDVATPGHCDTSPWRLLKKHGPPAIFVKSWEQLPKILAKERRLVCSPENQSLSFDQKGSSCYLNFNIVFHNMIQILLSLTCFLFVANPLPLPFSVLDNSFCYIQSTEECFIYRFSKQYKALRRLRVFQWYEWFKLKMRDRFIAIISSNLIHHG